MILPFRLLHSDLKNYIFSFHYCVHYNVNMTKIYFSFHHYVDYGARMRKGLAFLLFCHYFYNVMMKKQSFYFHSLWSQEKEIWFLLHHYLDYDHEKNILVFDSTTTFTMQITPYIYLLHLYVTNLSRKSPSQKNMHNSENFLPQEFQCSLS